MERAGSPREIGAPAPNRRARDSAPEGHARQRPSLARLFPRALAEELRKGIRKALGGGAARTLERSVEGRHLDIRLGPLWVDPGQLGEVLISAALQARESMCGKGTLTLDLRDREVGAWIPLAHPGGTATPPAAPRRWNTRPT